jgi:ceramide glucosyltransferase
MVMTGGVLGNLSVWQVIAWIGMAASVWFSLTAVYSGWEFFRRRREEDAPSPDWMPPVTVLKPLKGLDPELFENLSTFCQQDYAGLQIVFGVADKQDPAVAVVRAVQRAYPGLDIDLVIDPRLHGTNDKVSNLINMYRAAKHDVLVLADEDIRVPRDYLRRVVAPLRDERIGLVTCMYRAVAARRNLPTRLWCLTINTTLTPQILVARQVETPTYAFGATMALRRATLEAVHGFEEVASMLADDYQLGNRIAAQGLRLWLSACVVDTILEVRSWRGLLHHQVRRARTNRSHRPLGYFGTILTQALPWAVVNVVAGGLGVWTLAISGLTLGIRLAAAVHVARRDFGVVVGVTDACLLGLTDLLLLVVWALGFFGNSVWWRGRRFRIRKSGEAELVSAVPLRTLLLRNR